MRLVTDLFVVENQVPLIAGFKSFLPSGYSIDKDLNLRVPGDPVSNFYLGKDNEADSGYREFDLLRVTASMWEDEGQTPNRKTKEAGPASFNTSISYVNRVKVNWCSRSESVV